jgi:hypothetical protein
MIGRRLKAGGYSDVHPWSKAREAVHRPPSFVLAQDQRILRMLLLDAPPLLGHGFALRGEASAAALRAILATGRCHLDSSESPQLAEGPARAGRLRWGYLADVGQHIVCDTDPLVHHIPPRSPWYVDLVHRQCGPLDTGLPAQLAEALAAAPEIAPEHAALAREALSTRIGPAAPLPAVPAPHELREIPPVPRLRLTTLQAFGRSYRPLAHYLDSQPVLRFGGVRIMDTPPCCAVPGRRVVHIGRDARRKRGRRTRARWLRACPRSHLRLPRRVRGRLHAARSGGLA